MSSFPSRFPLGQIFITPGAADKLKETDIGPILVRHARCDWGDLTFEDKVVNDQALRDGQRLFSSYKNVGEYKIKVWIVTESDRSCTTILLPEEY